MKIECNVLLVISADLSFNDNIVKLELFKQKIGWKMLQNLKEDCVFAEC